MNYKTAMAEVFGKFPSPRARSAAIGLLAKYADPVRPVTAWHAVGDDAEAGVALLKALGFSEGTDFKVVRSELDPSAVRVGWTESGLELLAAVPRELVGRDLEPAQRAVLCAGRGDPLALVPDDTVSAPAEPAEPEPPGGLRDDTVSMTRAVARRLIVALGNGAAAYHDNDAALEWADIQLHPDSPSTPMFVPTPMAPLAALETLARAEGAQWLPPHRMFEPMPSMLPVNQASRLVRADETVPAGRINCMPLAEQTTDVTAPNAAVGPLRNYLAWTLDDWAKFPKTGDAVWTQFDARLCRTAEALNYALDAVRMRELVRRLVEHGYPGWRCSIDSTTRLAVCNTANGGVPGSENLETEDGDNSPLQDRIEECDCRVDELVYTGAFVVSDKVLGDGDLAAEFAASPTHPVPVAADDEGGEPDESATRSRGLGASEMAQEWFMMVHGGESWSTTDMTWRPREDRAQNRVANLARFRSHIGSMTDADALHVCSPENPLYMGDSNRVWSIPGAIVNGLCAAIRHHAGPDLQFVENSPHWPDRMVAGVWSGLMSDLAPDTPQGAEGDDVFPRFPVFPMGTGHVNDTSSAVRMSALLDLLHRRPGIQMRFGRRTKGVHREHTVVFETNVKAGPFLDAIDGAEFRDSVLRLFETTLLRCFADPLAGIPTHTSQTGAGVVSAAREWIDLDCPGLRKEFDLDLTSNVWFEVGWREDALGRLVLVVWTRVPEAAQRAKLAYRCAKCLPVASAAWLAAHGGAPSSLKLGPTVEPRERYRRVLAAALSQRGFSRGDEPTTVGMCGRFGPMWMVCAAWDLDYDEIPSHGWYTVHPEALVDVEQYLRPF